MTTHYIDGQTMRVFTDERQFSTTFPVWPRRLDDHPTKFDANGKPFKTDPQTGESVYPTDQPKLKQVVVITPGATVKSVSAGLRMMEAFLAADPDQRDSIYAEVRVESPS